MAGYDCGACEADVSVVWVVVCRSSEGKIRIHYHRRFMNASGEFGAFRTESVPVAWVFGCRRLVSCVNASNVFWQSYANSCLVKGVISRGVCRSRLSVM